MTTPSPRLNSIEPDAASGKTAAIYGQVKSWMKMIPNLYKGLANSPQALEAYLALGKLVSDGSLMPVEQQIVFMVTSMHNECTYCVAAHSPGLKAVGLSAEEIMAVRHGKSSDTKLQALIVFVQEILSTKGFVSDDDLAAVRAAGYTDANIADIMVVIAQKTMSNYFNHIHQTELDFPAAPPLS
jgi:uncharacterized peroxidase-related enzyme